MGNKTQKNKQNVEMLLDYLPEDYEVAGKRLGVIQRVRQIKTGRALMLLCLTYLYKGLTLVELSVYAALEEIAEISSVAFMKRFAKCGEWFGYIAANFQFPEKERYKKPEVFDRFRIIAVDASDIIQKGALKLEYHLHYAYDIFRMCAVEYKFTTNKVGETLTNFISFRKDDLIIADRAYGTITSIMHCLKSGADYILRLKYNAFYLYNDHGEKINLNDKLSEATDTKSIDFNAYLKNKKELIPVRICAIKKNAEALEKNANRMKRSESKHQKIYSDESKTMNQYIVLITSLDQNIAANDILELYRYRWQIELFFKRIKSLLQLGNLPNKKEENIMAWLNGEMLCAILVELVLAKIDFSPKELC